MSFKQSMSKLLAFFTLKTLFIIIGIVAIVVCVWLAGPLIAIDGVTPLASAPNRFAFLAILLLFWIMSLVVKKIIVKRQNDTLAREMIKGQGNENDDIAADQDISAIEDKLKQAISILRTAKLSKGKSIYQLPWYVLIGPPGSGKTTALQQSGLQFPLQKEMGVNALAGIAGTRHCDWWFTDKAVLIDTAGRYTTQDSRSTTDSRAWFGFLGLLRRYRAKQPINGVLISMSLADLLTCTQTERNLHARAIKQRIQELQNQLNMTFPIYVIFTKADLVAGFNEYFAELTEEEREQAWGFTLPMENSEDTQGVVSLFNKEFYQLIVKINEGMLQRLNGERDPKVRALIYEFPKQLRLLQSAADDFLKEIFAPNAFEKLPLLRGVFIASGHQAGNPIDRVSSQMASGFGLKPSTPLTTNSNEPKGFFLKSVLNDIIFAEQNIASINTEHARQHRWLRRTAITSICVFSVVLGASWWASANWNQTLSAQISEDVEAFKQNANGGLTITSDLITLGNGLTILRNLPTGYVGNLPEGWPNHLGLYQGDRLAQATNEVYQRALQRYLLSYVSRSLVSDMANNKTHIDYLYETLKTYLMLFERDYYNAEQIKSWFSFHLENNIPGEVNKDMRLALNEHLAVLLNNNSIQAEYNALAVNDARDILLAVPLADRAFARIEKKAKQNQLADFKLTNILPNESIGLFYRHSGEPMNKPIPALFTYEGFYKVFLTEHKQIIQVLTKDSWVYGDEVKGMGDDVEDQVIKQVKERYFKEYSYYWRDLIDDIALKTFATASQGAYITKVLTSPEQPIQKLLTAIQDNIELTKLPASEVAGKVGKLAGAIAAQKMPSATNRFKQYMPRNVSINVALPGESVENVFPEILALEDTDVLQIQTQMKKVHALLAQLNRGQTSGDKIVNQHVNLTQAGEPIAELDKLVEDLPSPFAAMIQGVIDSTTKISLQSARYHLNDVWQGTVYNEYKKRIRGRYPFKRSAKNEVRIRDFSRFFSPQGTMSKYFETYIKPHVRMGANRWTFKNNIGLSNESLKVFRSWQKIKNDFFESGSSTPEVEFALKANYLDRDMQQIKVQIDDQNFVYRHDPIRVTEYRWPGSANFSQMRVIFTPANYMRTVEKSYEGDWAWFRFLDDIVAARPKTLTDNMLEIKVQGHTARIQLIAGSASSPFKTRELEAFSCPAKL
ncbi:type VI secretion system membrane subunit TssM [Moritella yayanosii]|uniref:Putative Type VI secretion system, IcmF n=1 Tax=Moritella yayanosii TaxID=69539 RepID=A0A330LJT8_9GAMM|nr:type VI secretion system membrane subunit TssM [Moritella yayanosii]SQD77140.1 putative Type VI secretion system, IcmF [Moritella yayanosii]